MNLRVTPEEKRRVDYCAAALGMTRTELLMSGAQIISGMIEKHKENQKAGKAERGEDGKSITDFFSNRYGTGDPEGM